MGKMELTPLGQRSYVRQPAIQPIRETTSPVAGKTIPSPTFDSSYFNSDAFRAAVYNQALAYNIQQTIDKSKASTDEAIAAKQANTIATLDQTYKAPEGGYYIGKALDEKAVTDTELRSIGISQNDINVAQTINRTATNLDAKYRTFELGRNYYNVTAALAGGEPEWVLKQMFGEEVVRDAKNTLRTGATAVIVNPEHKPVFTRGSIARDRLEPYKSDAGYNISQALVDGKVTSGDLQAAGFSKADRDRASNVVVAMYASEMHPETVSAIRPIVEGNTVKQPKGLAQSLWWSVTPWKEERGQTVGSYGVLKSAIAFPLSVGTKIVLPAAGIIVAGAINPALGVAAATALGTFSAVETARNWGGMSGSQQAFSVGMTALCFVPALRAGARTLSTAETSAWSELASLRKAGISDRLYEIQKTDALYSANKSAIKNTADILARNYGKPLAESYKNLSKIQGDLLDAYIQLNRVDFGWEPARTISDAQIKVLEGDLISAANDFKTRFSQANPILEDVRYQNVLTTKSQIKEAFEHFPNNVLKNTKAFADAVFKSDDLVALKASADRASAALREAMEKYGGAEAGKFSDLMMDAAVKQSIYEAAQMGGISKMVSKLADIRSRIKSGVDAKGKPLTDKALGKLAVEATELEQNIASVMKGMEVEWPTQQVSAGRGTQVATKAPPETGTGTGTRATTAKPQTRITWAVGAPLAAELTSLQHEISTTIQKPTPAQIAKVNTAINTIANTVANIASQNDTMTNTDINTIVDNAIAQEPSTQTQNQLRSQVKSITKTMVSIKDDIINQRKASPSQRRRLIPIETTSGRVINFTEKQLKGSYAWKQGIVYKLWYPPHSRFTLISTRKKPPYVQFVEGEGSAQKSLGKIGLGAVTVTQIAPMGIVGVQVVKRKGKPFLRFPKRSVPEVRRSR